MLTAVALIIKARSNHLPDLVPLVPAILSTLDEIQPGAIARGAPTVNRSIPRQCDAPLRSGPRAERSRSRPSPRTMAAAPRRSRARRFARGGQRAR